MGSGEGRVDLESFVMERAQILSVSRCSQLLVKFHGFVLARFIMSLSLFTRIPNKPNSISLMPIRRRIVTARYQTTEARSSEYLCSLTIFGGGRIDSIFLSFPRMSPTSKLS